MSLRDLDERLIDFVSTRAALVQRWTGKDCLEQGSFTWRLAFLVWTCEEILKGRWGWAAVYGFLCILDVGSDLADELIRSAGKLGFRNPRQRELGYIVLRYIWLFSFPPHWLTADVIGGLWLPRIGYVSILLATWLRCCDPLPPCDGKIKEWIKGLFHPHLEPVGASSNASIMLNTRASVSFFRPHSSGPSWCLRSFDRRFRPMSATKSGSRIPLATEASHSKTRS